MRRAALLLSCSLHAAAIGTALVVRSGGGEVEPMRWGLPLVDDPVPSSQPATRLPPVTTPAADQSETEMPPVEAEATLPMPPAEMAVVEPFPAEEHPGGAVPGELPPRLLPTGERIVRPPVPPVAPEPEVAAEAQPVEPAAFVEARCLEPDNRAPDYPRQAVRQGHQGTVRVGVRVAADGTVAQAWLETACLHPELNAAALTAVRKFRFAPATRGGVAVEDSIVVPVEFRLVQ